MKRLCCLLIVASALLAGAPAAQADLIFSATMLGSSETPPNGSPATGSALVTLLSDNTHLVVHETFSGLIGGIATGAHIHCCAPPGVAAVIAIPFSIPPFPAATSGVFDQTFDLSSLSTYSAAFISANGGTLPLVETAFITGLEASQAYVNIHNTTFPAGEIRGQLLPVPEPASLVLLGSALLGFATIRRRKKHT